MLPVEKRVEEGLFLIWCHQASPSSSRSRSLEDSHPHFVKCRMDLMNGCGAQSNHFSKALCLKLRKLRFDQDAERSLKLSLWHGPLHQYLEGLDLRFHLGGSGIE